ncbi:MAG: hypothetical protein O3C68_02645 [Proteobacteria bacterium]|nr:hypothetical protein [Pseudomonadota bacterium]
MVPCPITLRWTRSKYLLYLILGVIALYREIFGDFLDFRDAMLWIFAFFFIEQNIVEWQQELEEQEEENGHAG